MAILIVEDNAVSAKLIEAFLNHRGFNIYWAQNGKEALAHLQARHRKIECILLDIMMPEMDGFEFLELKQDNRHWKTIPVIICSAFSNMKMVAKAISMGCKYYVVKPVNVRQLFQKIQSVIGIQETINSEKESEGEDVDINVFKDIVLTFSDMVRMKIDFIQNALKFGVNENKELDLSDISEASACFGAKWLGPVLDRLTQIYEQIKWEKMTPQLKQQLKMQINTLEKVLPTSELNQHPSLSVLDNFWLRVKNKNLDMQNEIARMQKCFQPDCILYMRMNHLNEKMITYDPIVNIDGQVLCESGEYLTIKDVTHLLKLAPQEFIVEPFRVILISEETIKKDEEMDADLASRISQNTEFFVDFDKALENVDGNADLLKELLSAFINEIPNYLDKMADCIALKNANRLAQISHKFKSNFYQFGAESIFNQIQNIENMARVNALSTAAQDFIRLEQSVNQFKTLVLETAC